ncbi:hypothetical protein NSK_008291 [Nannochloropsis salina CCMP1776]|uniref:Transmembrane protein n=1 Tax=Nannochloropsis salina CCMP1776 TaxID=1027361 RepID=A0A4D9CPG0_9STRA|nr:hypothetical protein NSK_008291 [Nannochloropsis salina CCMP1776]|eukprot:TFJ80384.1 hypothetical protein NSK_008291 [Nannochloropsis salina CCMP1776]
MPIIELRQRSRGYVELGGSEEAVSAGEDGEGFYHSGYAGEAAGKSLRLGTAPLGGGGPSTSHYQDGSDDDFSTSGPQGPVGTWARFRKTSRERLLRSFSPVRRSISASSNHPAVPRLYQLCCLFSFIAVVFLSSVAHILLANSPFLNFKGDKVAIGWVVVEVGREGGRQGRKERMGEVALGGGKGDCETVKAEGKGPKRAISRLVSSVLCPPLRTFLCFPLKSLLKATVMYACLLLLSAYLWYRHSKRRSQVGGVMYSRLLEGGGEGSRGIGRRLPGRTSYHDDPFLR